MTPGQETCRSPHNTFFRCNERILIAGAITARWYDPTNNTYKTVSGSPFANSGMKQLSPGGNNNEGTNDWVLVLTTQ